jgi:hypothetical protein
MGFTAIGNIRTDEASVSLINDHLGFPNYMIIFIGVAKVLGVLGILAPGIPRWIKEWSYAGLFFDLIVAGYAFAATSGFQFSHFILFIFILPGFLSYFISINLSPPAVEKVTNIRSSSCNVKYHTRNGRLIKATFFYSFDKKRLRCL